MNQLLHSWADPHARHAMMVHLPIVMALVAILPLGAAACRGECGDEARMRRWLRTAMVCLLAVSAGAWGAAQAGHDAVAFLRVADPALTESEWAAVGSHERRGSVAWVWPLIPAALAGLGMTTARARRAFAVLALVGSLSVAAWFCVIGHVGGCLVYTHGLGVPARPAIAGSPEGEGYK